MASLRWGCGECVRRMGAPVVPGRRHGELALTARRLADRISGRRPRSVARGAACLAGGTRGCRWGAFHGCVGGVEAAALRRLLDGRPEFHGRRRLRLDLLRFVLATVATTVDANTAWTDLAGGHGSGGNSRPAWRPHQSRRPRRRFPSWRLRCGSYAPTSAMSAGESLCSSVWATMALWCRVPS